MSRTRVWTPEAATAEAERRAAKRRRRGADLYVMAARARDQDRAGLTRDLEDLAKWVPMVESRLRYLADLTLGTDDAGPGAPEQRFDDSHGSGDGWPPEIRAAVELRDFAEAVRGLFDVASPDVDRRKDGLL